MEQGPKYMVCYTSDPTAANWGFSNWTSQYQCPRSRYILGNHILLTVSYFRRYPLEPGLFKTN